MSAAPCPPSLQAPVVSAMGHLAENWMGLNIETPAVIINPAASHLDVLAWCWGEVQSLCAAAQAMAANGGECDASDVSAVFLHRLAPLLRAMNKAVSDAVLQAKQGGAA